MLWHILRQDGAYREVLCGEPDPDNITSAAYLSSGSLDFGCMCRECAAKVNDEYLNAAARAAPSTLAKPAKKLNMTAVRKIIRRTNAEAHYD